MTYNEQVMLFGKTAIELADKLLAVFDRAESEAIARERISRYAEGTQKHDADLISFWAEVLRHVKTLQRGTRVYGNTPYDLAALNSCVERLRKAA